jgi:hypothetical protein
MRVILFTNKKTGEVECFSSLKPFYEKYPQYLEIKEQINYAMSRKKQPYKHSDFKLQRMNVH